MKIRQQAPTLDGIRDDHVERYKWAAGLMPVGGLYNNTLDVGCGVGYGSQILADTTGGAVYAFDRDPKAIAYAREHYLRILRNGVIYSVDEIEAMPYVSRRFLSVTAFEVIEHTPAALTYLAQLDARQLFGSVPNELAVPFDPKKHNKEHYRHFTPAEIIMALGDAGWNVTNICGQPGKFGDDAKVSGVNVSEARTLVFHAVRS